MRQLLITCQMKTGEHAQADEQFKTLLEMAPMNQRENLQV